MIGRDVIPDLEVYTVAALMIRKYGAMASSVADMLADDFLVRGDNERHAIWCRVLVAAEELLTGRPPVGARVH